ncbi:Non-structural maintenance of chromosome element 3 [Colletotrichum sp. SAR 10_99]|nr:Non-structural maintenance of chromosome element 3 [Colletotrichum sp. SAR 10_96]KAJ5017923.1 Non-structural maintenance of chromosome element 3 [Colletotrichum sp. SAR 10_99]
MPPTQRRRRQVEDESEEEAPARRQRRAHDDSEDAEEYGDEENGETDATPEDQLAKKLVRYVLACEFSRTPIRREGIKERVLGDQGRSFRKVFDLAQSQLRTVWGMELRELAVKEKFTMAEKRQALKSGSQAKTTSGVFVLSTTLPAKYRTSRIITPTKAPSAENESSYIGFYTLIISIIMLSSGELSDQKLRRYLNRVNAEANVAAEKTEDILKRMQAQGYVVRKVQKNPASQANDGSEDITWLVGPRGQEEMGIDGVAGLVRTVYGEQADESLERKIGASLGIQGEDGEGDVDMSEAPEPGPSR